MQYVQAYLREMYVGKVRRPYQGASGLQLEIHHPQGTVHAVYCDHPWPVEILLKIPFEQVPDGLFSLRRNEWWLFVEGLDTFIRPDRALRAAYEIAKNHIHLYGVQTPIDLTAPLSIDVAREVIEAYPPPKE